MNDKSIGTFGNAVNIDYVKNPENNQTFAIEACELEKYLGLGYIRLTKSEAVELMSKQ